MNFFVASGGSGGHLLPGIHIAKELKNKDSNLNIIFLISGKKKEKEILDPTSFEYLEIPAFPLRGGGLFALLKLIFLIPAGLYKTYKIFKEYKPTGLLGTGGYVTFFPVICAYFRRIPIWLHEAELVPGLANKFLYFFDAKVSCAFEETSKYFGNRAIYTGHPLRKGLSKVVKRELPKKPKNILILGGSLGAKAIDKSMIELAPFFQENNLSIFHQCREENLEELKAVYEEQEVNASVKTFFHDMLEVYSWADLIIARSGAGIVRELLYINLPAILIPLPSMGNEQLENANQIKKTGKGVVLTEDLDLVKEIEKNIKDALNDKSYNFYSICRNSNNLESEEESPAEIISENILKLIAEIKKVTKK